MTLIFKQRNKRQVDIIAVEGRKSHVVGKIFTPASNGKKRDMSIQVCGFDDAKYLWGCGQFGKLDYTQEATPFENVMEPRWTQAKDIQLEFDILTKPHIIGNPMPKCLRCYSTPCACEVKDTSKNPFTVKKPKE